MGNSNSGIQSLEQSETYSIRETIYDGLSKFWRDINSEGVVITSSYLFGVYSNMSKENLLVSPLSTIFVAAIKGIIYSLGGSFLMGFIPDEFRVIIPFSIVLSITSDQLELFPNNLEVE